MADFNVVSWDGNNINDGSTYEAGFRPGLEWGLPSVRARVVTREGAWPVVSGVERDEHQVTLFIRILASNLRSARDDLMRWFDVQDETPKQLVIEDDDGSDDRYVEAVCVSFQPMVVDERACERTFAATLTVSDDVRWRRTSSTSDTWNITSGNETHSITNNGSDDAYPSYAFTPNSAKTGGQPYKRYVTVEWRAPLPNHYNRGYPVRIGPIDTQTGSTNFDAADGSDIHLFVDGAEMARYVVDPDTANTYVWFSVSYQAQVTAGLEDDIASTGGVATITADDEISDFPDSGILLIGSEQFRYTGKDDNLWQFTGVTRGARGSSQAAHSSGDTIQWIQHDVVMTYGNASDPVGSMFTTDYYKPWFDLGSSSNTSWQYTDFGGFDFFYFMSLRPAMWLPRPNTPNRSNPPSALYGTYSGSQRTSGGDTWGVIGVYIDDEALGGDGAIQSATYWMLINHAGIVNAAWNQSNDGYMRRGTDEYRARLQHRVRGDYIATIQKEFDASDLASADTWYTWSEAAAGSDWPESTTLELILYFYDGDFEATDVTVTLSSTSTPAVSLSSETGNYKLSATLKNNTTGESIKVTFEMETGETLTVDTDAATVTYSDGDSNEYQALTFPDGVRVDWLRLAPGTNQLEFTDSGTADLDLVTTFEERYY